MLMKYYCSRGIFMEYWLNDRIPKDDVLTNIPWISNLQSIHVPMMFHWISDGRSIPKRYLRLMFHYVSLHQEYSSRKPLGKTIHIWNLIYWLKEYSPKYPVHIPWMWETYKNIRLLEHIRPLRIRLLDRSGYRIPSQNIIGPQKK